MEYLHVIFLGLVQGIGEFLPISSSGHLILVPQIFGWKDNGLYFDVALHAGTLFSILVYFRKDWIKIFSLGFGLNEKEEIDVNGNVKYPKKVLWIIAVATIPGVIAGLFLEDVVETVFRNPLLIAFNLFFWGGVLYLSDVKSRKTRDMSQVNFGNAFLIGLSQALAIIPGTSRSGVTISTGLLCGLDRVTAARLSFLMLTPIVFGATILKIGDITSHFDGIMLLGVFVSFVSGYFSIKYLIKFLAKASYRIFFWYRLALALLIVFAYL